MVLLTINLLRYAPCPYALGDLLREGGIKMFARQKVRFWRLTTWICLIITGLIFTLFGCTNPRRTLDRPVSGPQVIINPECIRLGVAKVMGTKIVFEGSGFKPGDSVFITLIGPNQTKAIVAEGPIKPDGTFKAEVSKLTKAMEILRADIGFDEKFKEFIIITQSAIPEGVYTVKVTSMLSDRTAETKLTVKGPSVIDRVKDWIGKLTGKIQHKKAK